jgi:hypothetical protein
MSNQREHETLTPQQVRQSLQAELDASPQAIEELSEEDLGSVSGGYEDPRQQPRPTLHPQHQNAAQVLRTLNQAPPLNQTNRRQTVAEARQHLEQFQQTARQLRAEQENRQDFAELPFFNAELP